LNGVECGRSAGSLSFIVNFHQETLLGLCSLSMYASTYMMASSSHPAWLFYSPLAGQAALLKDDLLDPVDALLDDPTLVDPVRQCLATRSPLAQLV
jgi:hypothetical protein